MNSNMTQAERIAGIVSYILTDIATNLDIHTGNHGTWNGEGPLSSNPASQVLRDVRREVVAKLLS